MFSCFYITLILYCPITDLLGDTTNEKRIINWSVRLDRLRNDWIEEQANADKPDEPVTDSEKPAIETAATPEPVAAEPVKQASETDTDTRKASEPTYRLLGKFETSHYTARCKGCSGITATGYDVRNTIHTPEGLRVVAVDTRVVPLHSTLRITYKNGTQIIAKTLDTGGAIKGHKLDVLVATRDEAYKLGRVMTTVEILVGKGD